MSHFDDINQDNEGQAPLDLSVLKKNKTKNDIKTDLETISKQQGWTDRQPRKPGPKRREPRTVLTMNGPERVLNHFRNYADQQQISQWQALEQLMIEANIIDDGQ